MSDYKHDSEFQRATEWTCQKCDCYISEAEAVSDLCGDCAEKRAKHLADDAEYEPI